MLEKKNHCFSRPYVKYAVNVSDLFINSLPIFSTEDIHVLFQFWGYASSFPFYFFPVIIIIQARVSHVTSQIFWINTLKGVQYI